MDMSGADTVMARVSVLLAVLLSLVAPVVPVTVLLPSAVGVPDTGQVTVAPAGTLAASLQGVPDGLMVQAPTLRPLGKPVTLQRVAPVASAVPTLLQLKLPV